MKIKLQEQPFQLLASLLEHAGDVVTGEELRERLWLSEFVDFDHSLNTAVRRLRSALDDAAENPRFIETLARLSAQQPPGVSQLRPARNLQRVFLRYWGCERLGSIVNRLSTSRRDNDRFTRFDERECALNLWNQRSDASDPVSNFSNDDDRDSDDTEVLLIGQTAVRGQHNIKTGVGCGSQQDAVAQSRPPFFADRRHIQPDELRGQLKRQGFIDENAQRPPEPLCKSREQRSPALCSLTETHRETRPANRLLRGSRRGFLQEHGSRRKPVRRS